MFQSKITTLSKSFVLKTGEMHTTTMKNFINIEICSQTACSIQKSIVFLFGVHDTIRKVMCTR